MDGNVQRPAEPPGDPRPLPVLVLPVSRRASRSGTARRSCARDLAEAAQMHRSAAPRSRRWTRWCWSATAWAGWCRSCRRSTAATTFGTWSARSRFESSRPSAETRQNLADTFFFHPNPSVRRVITIGTPHRGSKFANATTRWLGSKLIKLPQDARQRPAATAQGQSRLVPRAGNLIDVDTSIDSLAPDSPILPVMLAAQRPPWVHYHNIVGRVPDKGLLEPRDRRRDGDGVVSVSSAHFEATQSEVVVNSDHSDDPSASADRARSASDSAGAPGRSRRARRRASWSGCRRRPRRQRIAAGRRGRVRHRARCGATPIRAAGPVRTTGRSQRPVPRRPSPALIRARLTPATSDSQLGGR